MQIQVHDIDAEVAGARLAHQRVHVGAVHVEQTAFGVHDLGNFVDLLLEDAQRVRVGEHERRDIFIHLRGQRSYVHHALSIGFQILDRIANHGCRRGIGAMRGIGDQDFLARSALRLVVGANHQKSREFAMRPGGGLQRDGVHTGDFGEAFAQSLDNP